MTLTAAGARMPTTTSAIASSASMITASKSAASARSFFTLVLSRRVGCLVGVGEGLLGGVQHGLHLVPLLPDTPQRTAFALHRPAGDQVLGNGAEAEEPVEFLGDGEVLAVQHLDIGQVQQILAIATAWEPTSPADSGSEGLWPTATWMSPLLRDSLSRRRSF
jgi:hypothetical protein